MSAFESFMHAPFAGAVGWALLHSLWQGALLAAIFGALLLAIRSPRIRYVAACASLLLMLAGFCVTLFLMLPKGLDSARSFSSIAPGALAWPVQSAAPDSAASFGSALAALVPWLSLFWVAGVCFIYALRFAGGVSVARLRRRGVCSAPELWQRELARLRDRMRVSRPVLLLESCLADTPMVLGHFRPLILMPVGALAGLSPAQVEAILLHELAHVRRCDYLVNLLQRLIEGLFFYHPAIWWISRQARDERENCCDDAVVSISRNSRDYAAALTALEENRAAAGAAVAATGGTLVKRIRRLLYPQTPRSAWTLFLAAVLFCATAAVAIAAAWQAAPSRQSAATQTQVQTQSQTQAQARVIAATQEQQLTQARKELEQLKAMTSAGASAQQLITAETELQQLLTTTSQGAATLDQLAATQKQLENINPLHASYDARIRQQDQRLAELRSQIQAEQTQTEKTKGNAEPKDTQAQAQRAALQARLTATEKQLAQLKASYAPDDIRVREVETQLGELRRQIEWQNARKQSQSAALQAQLAEAAKEVEVAEARAAALRRQIQQMGDNPKSNGAPDVIKDAPLPPNTSVDGVTGGVSGGIQGGQVEGATGGVSGGISGIQAGSRGQAPHVVLDNSAAQDRAEAALSPNYRAWLQKDVVYIITPAERAAFLGLKTDSNRDAFIKNFWEKRTPPTGAADNSAKDEHYRRIAYADEHFAYSSVPGWRTAFGRIYIMFGPPDKIDKSSHLNSQIQAWRYNHVTSPHGNGPMTFVFTDQSGSGDYLLVQDQGALLPEVKH